MKVNSNNNRYISFNGFLNNKALKRGLEFAADNGTLFAATTTVVLSLTARPAAIMLTPKVDKENKKLAFTKSLVSTFSNYLVMLAFSKPIARSVKKIELNPHKYLNKYTISEFKQKETNAYSFATQLFKLGAGLLAAIPKAIITAATVPVAMKQIFPQKQENEKAKTLTFKGKLPKKIGDILNNKSYQEFSKKHKDSNFPMHIIALTDTLTTGAFIHQTKKNKNIDSKQAKILCYNTAIATLLSIIAGYSADKLTQKSTEKFIEQFKKANQNDIKLEKYLEGIKIAKPILLIGIIYYTLIPIISTFLAERIPSEKRIKTL